MIIWRGAVSCRFACSGERILDMCKKNVSKKKIIVSVLLVVCASMLLCACVPNGSPDDSIFEKLIDVSKEESEVVETGNLAESAYLTVIDVVSITPNEVAAYGVLKDAGVKAGVDSVRITGGTDVDVVEKVKDGYFIVPFTLPKNSRCTMMVTAMKDGKEAEEPLSFSAPYDATAEERLDGKSVSVGSDSRLHFSGYLDNYLGKKLYTRSQAKNIKSTIISQYKVYEELADGARFGLIYVFIPDPTTVDPSIFAEGAAKKGKATVTRYQQVVKEISATKANVIDMAEVLKAEMESGKEMNELFRVTDSHLTEYSSIVMYQKIMELIKQKYPEVQSRTFDDFTSEKKTVLGGDYVNYRGLDPEQITEEITLYTPKNGYGKGVKDLIMYTDTVNGDYTLFTTIDAKDGKTAAAERFLVNNENPELPNALIYRGENALFASKLIADSLGQTMLARSGDYFISMTDAKTYRNKTQNKHVTDFIIVFVSESDIAAAFGS